VFTSLFYFIVIQVEVLIAFPNSFCIYVSTSLCTNAVFGHLCLKIHFGGMQLPNLLPSECIAVSYTKKKRATPISYHVAFRPFKDPTVNDE